MYVCVSVCLCVYVCVCACARPRARTKIDIHIYQDVYPFVGTYLHVLNTQISHTMDLLLRLITAWATHTQSYLDRSDRNIRIEEHCAPTLFYVRHLKHKDKRREGRREEE